MIQRTRIIGRKVRGLAFLAILSGMIAISGCGDSGPNRYHVRGSVDFAGTPLPYGTIHFEPDTGNKGPQSYTEIVDGEYDTRNNKGLGVISGKVVVKIMGFKSKPDEGEVDSDEPRPALFEEFVKKIELPESESVEDFDIPKEAAATQRNVAPVNQGP